MNTVTVGSQYRFLGTLTKDGAVWDLTGATVQLLFKKPDATTVTKTATILSAAAGQVYYDSAAADLDQAGNWTRSWKVTISSVVDYTLPVQFTVVAAP